MLSNAQPIAQTRTTSPTIPAATCATPLSQTANIVTAMDPSSSAKGSERSSRHTRSPLAERKTVDVAVIAIADEADTSSRIASMSVSSASKALCITELQLLSLPCFTFFAVPSSFPVRWRHAEFGASRDVLVLREGRVTVGVIVADRVHGSGTGPERECMTKPARDRATDALAVLRSCESYYARVFCAPSTAAAFKKGKGLILFLFL